MNEDTQTVRSDDPRARELEKAGYAVVGESWGARLRLGEPPDLSVHEAAVDAATAKGFVVDELDDVWADGVTALEIVNHDDYPVTPATEVPQRDFSDVVALWATGHRLFGASIAGQLVAVTAIKQDPGRGETEFTSVHSAYRRQGLAVAVKAASIVALAEQGVRTFGTGGAQANTGSIRMNERLGYTIEERWLSYRKPGSGS